MTPRARLLWVLLVVFAAVYGLTDIRNRARTDRGPKYHRTDFTVYQAAAAALTAGTNPYLAENPRGLRYVYPPFLAILLMPVAHLPPTTAAVIFFALSFAALVWLLLAGARLPTGSPRAAALALLVTAGFFHQSFQRGQVTMLLLASEMGGLVLLLRRREFSAGFLLGLGGALRITPLFPALAAGAGALAAIRRRGPRPVVALSGGVVAALVLAFAILPALALGPRRALEVTREWVGMSRSVYLAPPGELADLGAEYHINEYRFKNQAVRRVLATFTGWLSGADFSREKPALSARAWRGIDLAAFAAAAAALGWLLVVAFRRLRDPDDPGYATVYAGALLIPLLVERYVWPSHMTAAFPALLLALGAPGARRYFTAPFLLFGGATILFYASYSDPIAPLGAAGPLLLAVTILIASSFSRPA